MLFLAKYFPSVKNWLRAVHQKRPLITHPWRCRELQEDFQLQPGEHVQIHQENETWITIDIDQTFGEIFLGPQYNLQGGYCFEILLTGKLL